MSDQPFGVSPDHSTQDGSPPPQTGSPSIGLPTGDALVSLVEGVQKHVQMLSGLKAEYESQAAEMARRSAELNDRFVQAAQYESMLQEKRAGLDSELEALARQRGELEAARGDLDRQRQDAEELRRQAESKLNEATERLRVVEERLQGAQASESQAAEKFAAAERHAADLAQREAAFEERHRTAVAQVNEEAMRQLDTEHERNSQLATELEASRAEISRREQELGEHAARVSQLENQASEQSQLIDQLNTDLAESRKSEAALAERQERLAEALARVEQLERDGAALRTDLAHRERELAEHAANLSLQERQSAVLLEQVTANEAKLAEAQQAALAAEELRNRLAEAGSRLADLERQSEAFRAEAVQREQDLAERSARLEQLEHTVAKLNGEIEELRSRPQAPAVDPEAEARAADLASKLTAAERDLESARGDIERLNLLAERARAGLLQARSVEEEAQALRSKIERADAENTELKSKAAQLHAALMEAKAASEAVSPELGESLKQSQAELGQAMRVIEALQAERQKLTERAAAAEDAARAAADASAATHTDFPDSAADLVLAVPNARRERLRRYRAALRAQRAKIDQVKDLLTQRLQEAQDVSTKKAALAAEQQHLEQTRLKIDAERAALLRERQAPAAHETAQVKRAGGGFGFGALALSVALAVLGGVSWLVAGAFQKPVAVASMVLGADAQNEDLTTEQADAWKNYISGLPEDERLVERAAERFKMRGFTDLSDVNTLAGVLKNSLDTDTTQGATVKFTLKYPGFERSALAVDTLATTIIGFANDSRDLRSDKASTVIISGAKAAQEPIEDPRLALFAAIYGALSALMLFTVAVVWRRAKAPADQSGRERPRSSPGVFAQAATAVVSESPRQSIGHESPPMPGGKNMLKSLGD